MAARGGGIRGGGQGEGLEPSTLKELGGGGGGGAKPLLLESSEDEGKFSADLIDERGVLYIVSARMLVMWSS